MHRLSQRKDFLSQNQKALYLLLCYLEVFLFGIRHRFHMAEDDPVGSGIEKHSTFRPTVWSTPILQDPVSSPDYLPGPRRPPMPTHYDVIISAPVQAEGSLVYKLASSWKIIRLSE